MKKSILMLNIFLLVVFGISCTKGKPPAGKYIGEFNGSYIENDSLFYRNRKMYIIFLETYKESIIASNLTSYGNEGNTFTLYKGKNKSISGIINITHSGGKYGYVFGPITINGHWEKRGSDYYISGKFSYIFTSYPEEPIVDKDLVQGDFEIKSKDLE